MINTVSLSHLKFLFHDIKNISYSFIYKAYTYKLCIFINPEMINKNNLTFYQRENN